MTELRKEISSVFNMTRFLCNTALKKLSHWKKSISSSALS